MAAFVTSDELTNLIIPGVEGSEGENPAASDDPDPEPLSGAGANAE